MMRLKPFLYRLMALLLVVTMVLIGCSSDSVTGLTGNYGQDTQTLLSSVNTNIELPDNSPERIESVNQLREQINDYTSRYRRDSKVAGLRSFTTM
ncbi:MAG: photosystem II protein Psb27, partial [Spirulinaceae cyanobacterium]